MALEVGTNSYLTVADADAYFSDRLYTDAWDNATDPNQAAALVMASRAVDRLPLSGKPATDTQTLAFPRAEAPAQFPFRLQPQGASRLNPNRAYDGPFDINRTFGPGFGYAQMWVVQDTVPQAVLDAVCEEGLALLQRGNSERRQMQLEGVQGFSLGSLSEHYSAKRSGGPIQPKGLLSVEAQELLAPWLAGSVPIR